MSTKELIFIFLLVFLSGVIVSHLFKNDLLSSGAIAYVSMASAFLAVIFNRIKHIDDLNLSRKKDTSLEFIKYMSEYCSTLISIIDPLLEYDEYRVKPVGRISVA